MKLAFKCARNYITFCDTFYIYRQEILAAGEDQELNLSNRHAAYRQFILWRHGHLEAGNRRVIPNCCVWKINDQYLDHLVNIGVLLVDVWANFVRMFFSYTATGYRYISMLIQCSLIFEIFIIDIIHQSQYRFSFFKMVYYSSLKNVILFFKSFSSHMYIFPYICPCIKFVFNIFKYQTIIRVNITSYC